MTLLNALEETRRLEPIEINEDNIKEIKYEGIIAMTMASGGAMGEPNGFEAVDENMQLYHSNFVSGKVDYKKLEKAFPILNYSCDRSEGGWRRISLGMGNYLLLREKYYEPFIDRVKLDLGGNYGRGNLYINWYNILQKVVLIKK